MHTKDPLKITKRLIDFTPKKTEKISMDKHKFTQLLLAIILISLTNLTAEDISYNCGWSTEYNTALEISKKENKPLLLEFSGSDWCPLCINLKKEVFDKKEFQDYADKNLVLVLAEFPHYKTLQQEITKQNLILGNKYGLKEFPTFILLNSQGDIIKKGGYIPGGVQPFLEWINTP